MSLGKLRFICWDKRLSIGKIAFLRGETKQVSCAFLITKPHKFFQASRIGRQTILGKFDWPACRQSPTHVNVIEPTQEVSLAISEHLKPVFKATCPISTRPVRELSFRLKIMGTLAIGTAGMQRWERLSLCHATNLCHKKCKPASATLQSRSILALCQSALPNLLTSKSWSSSVTPEMQTFMTFSPLIEQFQTACIRNCQTQGRIRGSFLTDMILFTRDPFFLNLFFNYPLPFSLSKSLLIMLLMFMHIFCRFEVYPFSFSILKFCSSQNKIETLFKKLLLSWLLLKSEHEE